jgi:hypothetical protein
VALSGEILSMTKKIGRYEATTHRPLSRGHRHIHWTASYWR